MANSIVIVAIVAALGATRQVQAQERNEVGAGVAFSALSSVGDFWGEGVHGVGLEMHASAAQSPTASLEASMTLGRRVMTVPAYARYITAEPDASRIEGIYAFRIRQRIGWDGQRRSFGFMTYGLAGYFGVETRDAYRETTATGTYSFPKTTSRNGRFGFPIVGGGFESALTPRLSVRADANLICFLWIPVGFRASAGFVVPLGR